MKKALPPSIALMMALAVGLQAGKTIHVPKDAPTIEEGLDRAEKGDTVLVGKGVYKERIVMRDRVALIGESAGATVIRGRGRGILVKGADKALLRNFTIENGEKGVLCENVSMTIEHNCIVGNKSSGIHCLVTLPMIRNNVVYRNGETGILCETVRSLNTLVEHNLIAENGHSGIMLSGNSEVLVQNNIFYRNKQFGIWVNEGARRSRVINNDFYLNRNNYNHYANVDKTNLGIDPEFPRGIFKKNPADLFAAPARTLKERGRGGKGIGLISEKEMMERGLDADNDGIPDDKDKCPSIVEDKDGFQDEDGCPDFDNDNDGIYDAQDRCPNQPEDKDGFEDEDGCPERDNDNDGIADSADACPGEPESVNGYKDKDGCPDRIPPGWKPETDTSDRVPAVVPDTALKGGADTLEDEDPAPVDMTKKGKTKKKKVPVDK